MALQAQQNSRLQRRHPATQADHPDATIRPPGAGERLLQLPQRKAVLVPLRPDAATQEVLGQQVRCCGAEREGDSAGVAYEMIDAQVRHPSDDALGRTVGVREAVHPRPCQRLDRHLFDDGIR